MANLFKFELVPNGLQVTQYKNFNDYDNNVNGLNCGVFTAGSTITWGNGQYILKDGDDAVIFTAFEIVDFINGRPYFSFPTEQAILEAFKGVLNSGVTANQSHNLPITTDYYEAESQYLYFDGSFNPTLNIIDYTNGPQEITVNNSYCKSINFYSPGVYGPVSTNGSSFVESITMPNFFSNFTAFGLPYLKEVYLYDGYSLYPGNAIDFFSCSLSQESVDRIIKACVNGERTNVTLELSGDNNAIPSSVGFDNIAILVSRGWFVFYND